MPPRKRVNFTQEDIDAQLQSVSIPTTRVTTENLEALGPIIKTITESRQQDTFLKTINGLIESKDDEIQKICRDNSQDFVSSVSTLLTVRSYTVNLRERVGSLDESMSAVGRNLAQKKKELLHNKKTAANLDEAIDTLQASLRILDVVKNVRNMIKDGRYWSALRSLDEIQSLPPNALSQTPLYSHLLSSLPSLRAQVKDAVTASLRTCLLEIREASEEVGKSALDAMRQRARRWRSRRDKEATLKNLRVGSAVELVTNEKIDYNLLDNDKVSLDLTPLHQSIHIYTALSALPELQLSYQRDRKKQASLIMTDTTLNTLVGALPVLTSSLLGFFVVEIEVLRVTVGFRNWRQVQELWDDVAGQLVERIENGLRYERDPHVLVEIKDILIPFVQAMELYEFDTSRLQAILIGSFEKHTGFIAAQYAILFDKAVADDDYQPMLVTAASEREAVLSTCWMAASNATALARQPLPVILPFSVLFYTTCTHIRKFVELYYKYCDNASHYYRHVDALLLSTLDNLLTVHVSEKIAACLPPATTLFQVAQVITNVEHFVVAIPELEQQLARLRTSRTGGQIHLLSAHSFDTTLALASDRISGLIKSKLNDFFELAEYDWTPSTSSSRPSMYLEELYHWLMTVVDSLPLDDRYKNHAFGSALDSVAASLMDFLCGRDIPMVNEHGIMGLLVDVDFLESEFTSLGKANLAASFVELRQTTSLVLNPNAIMTYLQPAARRSTSQMVNPKNVAALLQKLVNYGSGSRVPAEREAAERRRRDLEALARLG